MEATFLKSAYQENHYPLPDKPEIAFAGRSNVGKSSLINVLVNRKKIARISSTPGRTQALNFFLLNNRLYLVDLPGYGFARVPLNVKQSWRGMVETYFRLRTNLKGVVVILDIRRDPSEGDLDLLRCLKQYQKKVILVLTKADKLSRNRCSVRLKTISQGLEKIIDVKPIIFSAKTKEGREEIWREINGLI
ncbi:MAG: YihA family ribosome biogenesis GTP-binding protein [Deltaproteobacteria bacterium]|nr:YihA family ribosome biogenesis GTP-binding protein [Deltaproteobacteria bacterium]